MIASPAPPTRQGDHGRLREVLVRHVRDTWCDEARVEAQWRGLNYTGRPAIGRAVEEHDLFLGILESRGALVRRIPPGDGATLDAIYPRDAAVVCDDGLILCAMGKAARREEPQSIEAFARDAGIPVIGRIEGDGLLEGGDVAWLDERTVAVGIGPRTNASGCAQFRRLLGDRVDEFIEVPLPEYRATGDVFHLASFYSPVDADLAVVHRPLLPTGFADRLRAGGVTFVEVPPSEFESLGCNVLALAPRCVVMIEGNPITRERLETAGVEVICFPGEEICLKGCGGPTCLTRPLARDRAP